MNTQSFEEQFKNWISEWKTRLEEMQVQFSLGKMDAIEAFEKVFIEQPRPNMFSMQHKEIVMKIFNRRKEYEHVFSLLEQDEDGEVFKALADDGSKHRYEVMTEPILNHLIQRPSTWIMVANRIGFVLVGIRFC